VKSIAYVPRSKGLDQMRERFKGQIDMGLLTTNPLPNVLRVRLVDAQDVDGVATSIRKHAEVANVEYAADVVTRMLKLFDVLGKIGLGIVALLIFTAAIIISNTIRLTVFARRREIAIMQLVGASGLYVRMPFIVEGLLDGVLGAGLAIGLLELARFQLLPKLALAVPFIEIHATAVNDIALAGELVATGAIVGMLASWISVGRYLRA
jgi:cell division transport system permease protein